MDQNQCKTLLHEELHSNLLKSKITCHQKETEAKK
jgi:hypothetical protein